MRLLLFLLPLLTLIFLRTGIISKMLMLMLMLVLGLEMVLTRHRGMFALQVAKPRR